MMKAPDPSDLHTALVLLRSAHLARAAKELGRSPSAMSHALRRLRKQFGDDLLVRSGREWVLTPLGSKLREELERSFLALERLAQGGAGFDPNTSERRFVIATADYAELVFLPELFALLRQSSKACALDVVRPVNIDQQLDVSRVDVLIVPEFELPDERLVMQRLFQDELVLAGRPTALGEIRGKAAFARAAHGLTSPTGQLRTDIDTALEGSGRARRVLLSSPSFVVPALAASRSDIVTAIPRRLARIFAPQLGLVTHPHPLALPPFNLAMMWHPRMRSDPAHRWLRALVIEASKRLKEADC